MRLAFMGTPEFSVPFLRALHQAGHEIAAVYTQPPRQAGRRGLEKTPSPVQKAAEKLNIPVYTPKTLRDTEEQKRFAALKADAAVIVAYGLILPEPILSAPRLGCYNAHASLLPRWRGAAPVQRAIAAGDKETGIMIMRMDKGLDTGPVLCAQSAGGGKQPFVYKMPIAADMVAGAVFAALSAAGAELMAQAAAALEKGAFSLMPQAETGITYAHKIEKAETRINWLLPAAAVHKHICSLSPAPGAWAEMEIGGRFERVKILASHLPDAAEWAAAKREGLCLALPQGKGERVSLLPNPSGKIAHLAVQCGAAADSAAANCGENMLLATQLQRAGGKTLPARDFLRGAKLLAVR